MSVATTADAVLSAEELQAVAARMAAAGVDVAGSLAAARIAGGRSNLTVRLTDGASTWVMRMPPRAGRTASAHDVGREFRVTSALFGSGVPVPRPVVLCDDESLIGAPFAIAEYVDGQTIQSREDLDALDAHQADALVPELVGVLARLHEVDYVAHGLGGFGRPDGYAARQLRRWSGQWETVGLADAGSLADEVVARLGREIPPQRHTSVVHGDFRIDNTLVTLDPAPQISAVVDWELSTIGDPVADVAMMCVYRHPAFDLIIGSPTAWASPRLPEPEDLAAAYERAGGVELADWEFHTALAAYKVAVIAAGIDFRYRQGVGRGAGFGTAGQAVVPFLDAARAVL